MAILKHLTNKSGNYGKALEYLIYQHNEYTQKPIPDRNGNLQVRDELYLDGMNCQPLTFAKECEQLNAQYHKNQTKEEVKAHHYIISFDPEDVKVGLTGEKAQNIGLEFAREFFEGHQALVCTHTDGHNQSGNIHVHIIINSLRKYDAERRDFMERDYDNKAGYKHHQTRQYLTAMQEGLMKLCEREHLHQVDLLSPAADHETDREYRLKQRQSAETAAPFQTQKQYLQDAIRKVSSYVHSPEEFGEELKKHYGIQFKISRGRFSYLHPERQKYMTGRTLGNDYTEKYLLPIFEANRKAGRTREQMLSEVNAVQRNTITERETKRRISADHPAYDPSYDYNADPVAAFYFRTRLRLVVDLQSCAKAQASHAYARKVKLTNLQQMARTICYVQEHRFETESDIEAEREMNQTALKKVTASIKSTDQEIRSIRSNGTLDDETTKRLDFLTQSRKQLVRSQSFLRQYVKDLEVVKANVNVTLHPSRENERVQMTEKTQDL